MLFELVELALIELLDLALLSILIAMGMIKSDSSANGINLDGVVQMPEGT